MQVPSNYSLKNEDISSPLSSEDIKSDEEISFDLIFKTTAKLCRDYAQFESKIEHHKNDPVAERIRKYVLN